MVRRQTARFDLRIEPDLLKAVERLAKARDRTAAWIVRDAIRRYVAAAKGEGTAS